MPYPLKPGSYTVAINLKINLLSVSLRPSTTSLPCPGALAPRSIIILQACDNIDNKYITVAHPQCSEQSYLFFHIVLKLETIMGRLFNHSMVFFCVCLWWNHPVCCHHTIMSKTHHDLYIELLETMVNSIGSL